MRLRTFVVDCTACAAAFGAALALVSGAAAGADSVTTLYQWTDSKGTFRYTPDLDRIPNSARNTVLTIQSKDEEPADTPIYFEPDPRASDVSVPDPPAPTTPEPPVVTPSTTNAAERNDRIRVLEAQIAAYEEQLKAFITQPGRDSDADIPPELREVAERLPHLQAELAGLKARSAGAGAP